MGIRIGAGNRFVFQLKGETMESEKDRRAREREEEKVKGKELPEWYREYLLKH